MTGLNSETCFTPRFTLTPYDGITCQTMELECYDHLDCNGEKRRGRYIPTVLSAKARGMKEQACLFKSKYNFDLFRHARDFETALHYSIVDSQGDQEKVYRAQMKEFEFCCIKKCFTRPEVVLGRPCVECKVPGLCMCACVSYQKKQREVKIARRQQKKTVDRLTQEKNRQYREFCKLKTAVKNARYRAQMFDEIWNLPAGVNKMTSSFSALSDTVLKMIDDFRTMFKVPSDIDLISIVLTIVSLYSSIATRSYFSALVSIVAIARLAKFDYSHWIDLIQTALTGTAPTTPATNQPTAPAPTPLQAQMFEQIFASTSVITLFGTVLVSGFSLLMGGGTANYPGILKHLSDFGRAALGWTKVTEMFHWIVDFIKNIYFQVTLGKTLEEVTMERKYPLMQSALARCELLRSPDTKLSYLERDVNLCTDVMKLEDQLLEMKFDAIRARQTDLVTILTTELQRLNSTFLAARNSAAHSHNIRPAPTTLYCYGRAGVGKSNFLNYLKCEIYKRKYVNDPDWNMNNISHTRCSDNEYWDGILPNQPIVIYDDLLQAKDTVANPNPEIMEIIRIKNEAAYHLHMSAVADKKNSFFTSAYVLASTNVKVPTLVSISDDNAFKRRWDFVIEVKVNPLYSKTSPDGSYQMIDGAKVDAAVAAGGPQFNKDVYLIDAYSFSDGVITADMSLDTFITDFFAKSDTLLESSDKLADSMRVQCGLTTLPAQKTYAEFAQKWAGTAQMDDADSDSEEEFSDSDDPVDFFTDTHMESLMDNLGNAWAAEKSPVTQVKRTFSDMLQPVKDSVSLKAAWIQLQYTKLSSSQTLKDCSTWCKKALTVSVDKINTLGHWLYSLVTNTSFIGYFEFVIGTLIGAGCMLALVDFFQLRGCALHRSRTYEQLMVAEKCKTCRVCDKFDTKGRLGTHIYAHDAIETLCITDNYAGVNIPVWMSWSNAHKDEYIHEISHLTLNAAASFIGGFSAESKEIMTRGIAKTYVAESKETVTRGVAKPYLAEAIVPIYSDSQTTGLKLVSQMKDQVMHEQWTSVTGRNTVTLLGPNNEAVNAVFITGRTLLTVNHFIETMKARTGTFYIRPIGQTRGNQILISRCQTTICTDYEGQNVDLVFVTVPEQPSRPNIIQKFATASSLDKVSQGDFVLAGIRPIGTENSIYCYYGEKLEVIQGLKYDSKVGPAKVNLAITYQVDTRDGDCGALVYARNPYFVGKIFGMHVAGNGTSGAAAVLTREFIQRNLDKHVRVNQLITSATIDARVPFSGEMKDMRIVDKTPTNSYTKLGNCLSLGMLAAPFASTKTNIRPSLISGTLQEPIMKPAFLRPAKNQDGVLIDPMEKGVMKVMGSTDPLDQTLLDIASDDVASIHLAQPGTKEVLTFEEAVTGVDGCEYMTPLNRTTSPGYPYCLDNKGPGKREWFGYGDYIMSDEIRQDVDSLLTRARANQRGDVVWTATLKDERRMIEKADAIKTRVFATGPMHYTVAVRMYFLRFVETVMKNRIFNEVGVGTNVYSLDWDYTGNKLSTKGKNVIAGDFSNYDGSLLQSVVWKIIDMINDWYDDGPENRLIRNVLAEEICNARVLVGNELIQWDHSQPSGNPLTVIINSLFNQIIMRYAYLACKQTANLSLMCDFTDHVSLQTYGDDNVLNISNEMIDVYNQITITAALARAGLTYTDEGKTGTLVKARTLADISYLKRKFVRNQYGFFEAPLDLGVCKEMTNWIRGLKGDGRDETFENARTALAEFYFHGASVFDETRQKLDKALKSRGITQRLPMYAELESFYSHARNMS